MSMNYKNRISVAMIVYNGERFLQDQLDSILRQTRLPDELVVSDDASTDRSLEIVRKFATHAPFAVRICVNESNLGYSKNLERAIRYTTGDIIVFCDCDDVWYPAKLQTVEIAFATWLQAGVVIHAGDIVDEHLRPVKRPFWFRLRELAYRPWVDERRLAQGMTFNHYFTTMGPTMAFRAKFKPLVLPFPDDVAFRIGWADFFASWAIVCSGAAGLGIIRTPLFAYRRHPNQISGYGKLSRLGVWRKRLARLRERPLVPLVRLIERIEDPAAASYCVNPKLRAAILRHWRARCYMPEGRLARIPLVMRELLSLRYHRFSSGFLTAFKDLVFVR